LEIEEVHSFRIARASSSDKEIQLAIRAFFLLLPEERRSWKRWMDWIPNIKMENQHKSYKTYMYVRMRWMSSR